MKTSDRARAFLPCASLLFLFVLIVPQTAGGVPVGFIENTGQLDEEVLYYASGTRASVYFTLDGIVIDLKNVETTSSGCAVYISFDAGAAPRRVEPADLTVGSHNSFIGRDRSKWRTDLRAYRELTYDDVWPGVDITYRMSPHGLIYELSVAPGVDVEPVGFSYAGALDVTETGAGELLLTTSAGSLIDVRPSRDEAGSISWSTGSEMPDDTLRPGRLDPTTLLWSTFLGGSAWDHFYVWQMGMALDTSENPIVVGVTGSSDFPFQAGSYDTTLGGSSDVFVAKLGSDGETLMWSTYLGGQIGGQAQDVAHAVALDASGDPIVTGWTECIDFPTTAGAIDTTFDGDTDIFVTKLSSDGSNLIWSTLLGGQGYDAGNAIAVDPIDDRVSVAGRLGWGPTAAAYAAKLSAGGDALIWEASLDGDDEDVAMGIALDAAGLPVVSGTTLSDDFPTTPGVHDDTLDGKDVFVAKLDGSGSTTWSTFLGGTDEERGGHLTIDTSNNPLVTGRTRSWDYPTTTGVFDDTLSEGSVDAYVTKLMSDGSDLVWSSFLGGDDNWDEGWAITLDGADNPIITGRTYATDFPMTPSAYDTLFGGLHDVFVTKMDAAGDTLIYSTYLGGSAGAAPHDIGLAVAADAVGNAVVAGYTQSSDFPWTTGAYDSTFAVADVFVAKFDMIPPPPTTDVSPDTRAHSLLLMPNSPNPFRAGTSIRFRLASAAPVTLAIYDVRGRMVRMLVGRTLPEGEHSVRWDGRTEVGRLATSGIYFLRLATRDERMTDRMLLLE